MRKLIWPDSIFSTSRMSLIRRARRSLFFAAMSTKVRALSGSSPVTPPAISPSAPRIEVSGVRSSWLTTEMKSLFNCSTRLWSSTSRAMP